MNLPVTTRRLALAAAMLAAGNAFAAGPASEPPAATTIPQSAAGAKYQALRKEYDEAIQPLSQALQAAATDAEKEKIAGDSQKLRRSFAKRFLEFAESNPRYSSAAFDALVAAIDSEPSSPEAAKAMEILQRDYLRYVHIFHVCDALGRADSPAAEKLLRAIVETNHGGEELPEAYRSLGDMLKRRGSPEADKFLRYHALTREYQKVFRACFKATNEAASHEERTKIFGEYCKAFQPFSRQFLELAEENPSDPFALDALAAAIQSDFSSSQGTVTAREGVVTQVEGLDSSPTQGPVTARVIEILQRDYVQNPRIGLACIQIHADSPAAEKLLRAIVEKNPDRDARRLAGRRLGDMLKRRGSPEAEKFLQEAASTEAASNQYFTLSKEENDASLAFSKASREAGSKEEKQKLREDFARQRQSFAARFLELARKNPNEFFTRHALVRAMMMNPSAPEAIKAIEVFQCDHVRDPHMDELCQLLSQLVEIAAKKRLATNKQPQDGQLSSDGMVLAAEKFFRAVLEKNPERDARGAACLGLARLLQQRGSPEAEKFLEEAVAEYGNVRYGRTTVGEMAQAAPRLAIGKIAPDISGENLDGKPMKLSEFRGKVVVLDFWGHWCGACWAMIPHERSLVKRLEGKPFALLGINSDSDREQIKTTVAAEQITWRSWWDGGSTGGPIASVWGVHSWPTIYVLDAKGVIRFKDVRGEALDQAVDTLLAEQAKGGR